MGNSFEKSRFVLARGLVVLCKIKQQDSVLITWQTTSWNWMTASSKKY